VFVSRKDAKEAQRRKGEPLISQKSPALSDSMCWKVKRRQDRELKSQ